MTHPDGRKYEGEFKQNTMTGVGTFTLKQGHMYLGQFSKNFIQGLGKRMVKGSTYGVWEGTDVSFEKDGLGVIPKPD